MTKRIKYILCVMFTFFIAKTNVFAGSLSIWSGAKEVTVGQKLVEFDIDLIKEAGYSTITPVVVTNTANYNNVSASELETVNAGDELITID